MDKDNKEINEEKMTFSLSEVPIGKCFKCDEKQESPGEDGIWIMMQEGTFWVCYDCKYKYKLRSYPMQCEWCTFRKVIWCQGHTYDCPRCKYLKIGQANYF